MLVRVRGRSMVPTLRPGDILWAGPPRVLQRGNIVLVEKKSLLIKRLIGLPGDTVACHSGKISVNGALLSEPYVPEAASLEPQKDQTLQLSPSAYFVLGDTRDDSLDSRRLGPIDKNEIIGVVRRRLWPPTRWGAVAVCLAGLSVSVPARAQEGPARLLAFASETRLAVMIGKYEPGRGWVQATDFYAPPEPGDAFTLYGTTGAAAEVTITDKQRSYSGGVFADWNAKVSRWDSRAVPYALAVSGRSPLPAPDGQLISPDNPEYGKIVSAYLKSKGLHVEQPLLTQAVFLPVQGHGREEAVLVAHSDASALSDEKEADIYAVALLWWNDGGNEKTLPLFSQTSHKPAGQAVEDHSRYHRPREFVRLLAAVDIDGDGWKEMALYRAKESSTEVDVFHFNGRRLRKVLSAEKAGYN